MNTINENTIAIEKPLMLNLANIEEYMNSTAKIEKLDAKTESELANEAFYHDDEKAREALITSSLNFVVYIARKYVGYGLPLADLIQEGNIGLIKASQRFNPEKGVRFTSYAVHWIKAQIHDYVIANWRIVKSATTKAQRKLFFNLRKNKEKLGWLNNQEVEKLSSSLDVKPSDVIEMDKRLGSFDEAFETENFQNNDEGGVGGSKLYLKDDASNFSDLIEQDGWQVNQQTALSLAMKTLDDRSKDIINQRWLTDEKQTLTELAEKYKISAERVRQLEVKAMDKLKLSLV